MGAQTDRQALFLSNGERSLSLCLSSWQAGGPFMWLLLIMSITSVTYIIERSLSLRCSQIIPQPISDALDHCRDEGDVEELYALCQQHDSPIGRLLIQAMKHFSYSRLKMSRCCRLGPEKRLQVWNRGWSHHRGHRWFRSLAGAGRNTAWIDYTFGDFGSASMADHSALAKGISIALNTTLTGLLIAIPSSLPGATSTRRWKTSIEMEHVKLFPQRFYPPIADPTVEPSATDGKTARARKARRKSD